MTQVKREKLFIPMFRLFPHLYLSYAIHIYNKITSLSIKNNSRQSFKYILNLYAKITLNHTNM